MGRDDVNQRQGVADDDLSHVGRGLGFQDHALEHVDDRRSLRRIDPEATGQGELRIEVDGEDASALAPPRSGEVGDRRGLANSPLLRADGDRARHAAPFDPNA